MGSWHFDLNLDYEICILFWKLFWSTARKKNVLVIETKLLEIQNLGYLYKKIVITRTVLSNCEGQNDIGIREYFTSLVTGGF